MMAKLKQGQDLFSYLAQPEYLINPYPVYTYLRDNFRVFISEMPPNFLWRKLYCIPRYHDIVSVLKSNKFGKIPKKTEKSAEYQQRVKRSITSKLKDDVIVFIDPPRHTRIKSVLSNSFTPKYVSQLRPQLEEIAYDLLEKLKDKKEFDLKADFAYPFPVHVIARLLGVPDEDIEKLKVWSSYLVKSVDAVPMSDEDYKMTIKSGFEIATYLQKLIKQKRSADEDDLTSKLVKNNNEEEKLSIGELISNLGFLLIAGHETTMNLICNGTLALLSHPDQLEMFKSDPKLVPSAVEEMLRFESPVQLLSRVTQEPVEIAGTAIPEGEQVGLLIGAGNRDPEVFEDPDKFDITRKENPHLSFGHGIHYCLGAPLGRLEGEIALKGLFEMFPSLKLEEKKPQYRPSASMRELLSLRLST